jgi:hypothetical protein
LVGRLRRRGIPARTSRDAGRYVCNALLYSGLEQARQQACRLGFVHLPAELAPDHGRRNGMQMTSPLTWPQALLGGLELIGGCFGRPVPQHSVLSINRRARGGWRP